MGQKFKLELYVSGDSLRSEQAAKHLERILRDAGLADACEVEVIDVLEDAARAEAEGIIATPTVINKRDGQEIRAIGDLSDHQKVADLLCLPAKPH